MSIEVQENENLAILDEIFGSEDEKEENLIKEKYKINESENENDSIKSECENESEIDLKKNSKNKNKFNDLSEANEETQGNDGIKFAYKIS